MANSCVSSSPLPSVSACRAPPQSVGRTWCRAARRYRSSVALPVDEGPREPCAGGEGWAGRRVQQRVWGCVPRRRLPGARIRSPPCSSRCRSSPLRAPPPPPLPHLAVKNDGEQVCVAFAVVAADLCACLLLCLHQALQSKDELNACRNKFSILDCPVLVDVRLNSNQLNTAQTSMRGRKSKPERRAA